MTREGNNMETLQDVQIRGIGALEDVPPNAVTNRGSATDLRNSREDENEETRQILPSNMAKEEHLQIAQPNQEEPIDPFLDDVTMLEFLQEPGAFKWRNGERITKFKDDEKPPLDWGDLIGHTDKATVYPVDARRGLGYPRRLACKVINCGDRESLHQRRNPRDFDVSCRQGEPRRIHEEDFEKYPGISERKGPG